ncbi:MULTISPECIES: transcription termination/antitermination NusG family protein [unclassified Sodalis]|uniref:transcription termination/antitermination NusG family protein n=1 Tax=Sodalis TaxID=84565 RepID=UPI0009FDD705|nr:transcription termination/antitermination NusG family protein [Candidatus Sodalis sp. SoCistrobi]
MASVLFLLIAENDNFINNVLHYAFYVLLKNIRMSRTTYFTFLTAPFGTSWAVRIVIHENRCGAMWHLLYHHKRRFSHIVNEMKRLKVSCLSPTISRYTPRKDRGGFRCLATLQLFPGYIFVDLDVEKIHTSKITAIDGAICFVRFGGYPFIISDKDIQKIREIVDAAYQVNDEIHIKSGVDGLEERNKIMIDIINTECSERRIKKLNDWLALPCHLFERTG